jgi:hypothetical protein
MDRWYSSIHDRNEYNKRSAQTCTYDSDLIALLLAIRDGENVTVFSI